jgi:hypothetical protein
MQGDKEFRVLVAEVRVADHGPDGREQVREQGLDLPTESSAVA